MANTIPLLMDPTHLEPGEVTYELQIRAFLGPLEDETLMAEPMRLIRRLADDAENNREPSGFGVIATDVEKIADIRDCADHVQTIHDTVERLYMDMSEDHDQIYRLASRSVHYHHRLARITTDSLEAAVTDEHQRAVNQVGITQRRIKSLLQTHWLERREAENSGRTANANPSTEPNGDSRVEQSMSTFNEFQESLRLEREAQATALQQCIQGYLARVSPYLKEINEGHKTFYPEINSGRLCEVMERLTYWRSRLEEEVIISLPDPVREEVAVTIATINSCLDWVKERLREKYALPPVDTDPQTPNAQSTIKKIQRTREETRWNDTFVAQRDGLPGLNDRITKGNDQRDSGDHWRSPPPISTGIRPPIDDNPVRPTNGILHRAERATSVPKSIRFEDSDSGSRKSVTKKNDLTNAWPREPNALRRYRNYHPAIISVDSSDEEPEEEFNRPRDHHVSHVSKNQQFVTKALGNRKFDGLTADGTRTLGIDELIGQLRYSKTAIGLSERELLSLLPTFMVGEAWQWWNSRSEEIRSVNELEINLKRRFAGEIMTGMGLMKSFMTRYQGENENLLAFMDNMRQRAKVIRPALEEGTVITTIVDNANLKCKVHLANRSYNSLHDLNQHMEWLISSRILNDSVEKKPNWPPKRPFYPPKHAKVYATEAEGKQDIESETQTDKESEFSEEHKELLDYVWEKSVEAITRKGFYPRSQNSRSQHQSKSSETEKTTEQTIGAPSLGNQTKSSNDEPKFSCYGCGKPNVYKRNCTDCNMQKAIEAISLCAEKMSKAAESIEAKND